MEKTTGERERERERERVQVEITHGVDERRDEMHKYGERKAKNIKIG